MVAGGALNMKSRKPTGSTGSFKATVQGDGSVIGAFEKIQLPAQKDAIESFVLEKYVEAINTGHRVIASYVQNPENHFDFTLTAINGSEHFVDLVEFVLPAANGSPYAAVGDWISHKEVADGLVETVNRKSAHYGRAGTTPIHLLVYITHYRFKPSEEAVRLAQHRLNKRRHSWASVQLITLRSQSEVRMRPLFPVDGDPLDGNTPESFQDLRYLMLDAAEFKMDRK
jgi:hypothetical protein